MSIHLMSLCWKVKFPTHTQFLALMKCADFADDDGRNIFPALETIADNINASKRQVQYAMSALEKAGILFRVGKSVKGTIQWNIDVQLLAALHAQEVLLQGAHDTVQLVDKGGAIIAPPASQGGNGQRSGWQWATDRVATNCHQSSNNHQLKEASADARDISRTLPAVDEKPLTMFELTPKDVTWKTWLSLMEAKGRTDLADAAIEAGKIQVRTKWPDSEKGLQGLIADKLKKSANYTHRMLGESA